MREYKQLISLKQVENFIQTNELAFLFIYRENCSVCHALLPQVRHLLEDYPTIQLGTVLVDEVNEVAGHLSIFTVPVLLLFVSGKEYIREARVVHMDLLEQKINKIYNHF